MRTRVRVCALDVCEQQQQHVCFTSAQRNMRTRAAWLCVCVCLCLHRRAHRASHTVARRTAAARRRCVVCTNTIGAVCCVFAITTVRIMRWRAISQRQPEHAAPDHCGVRGTVASCRAKRIVDTLAAPCCAVRASLTVSHCADRYVGVVVRVVL